MFPEEPEHDSTTSRPGSAAEPRPLLLALREQPFPRDLHACSRRCLGSPAGRMPVSGAVSIGGRTPWVENDSRHRVQVPPPKSGRPVHGWWHDGVPSQHDGKDAAAAVNRLKVRSRGHIGEALTIGDYAVDASNVHAGGPVANWQCGKVRIHRSQLHSP